MEAGARRWMCASCAGGTAGESEFDLGVEERAVDGHVNGGNMGIRKRALAEVGYFDEEIPNYGEETEWEDRLRAAGGRIVYLPEAWLWHRRTPEQMRFRTSLMRAFRRGRGNAYYSRSIGDRIPIGPLRVLKWLVHAVRRRCQGGLLRASWTLGFIVGSTQFTRQSR
jgi:GT2 family glycosyltransferase